MGSIPDRFCEQLPNNARFLALNARRILYERPFRHQGLQAVSGGLHQQSGPPACRQGLAVAQLGDDPHEPGPGRLGGLARLVRLGAGQRGDGNDDPLGDVDEQLGHPRFSAGELAGEVHIVGLDVPEVAEDADGRVGVIGGEQHGGVGHVDSSRTGRPADRGSLGADDRGAALWTESADGGVSFPCLVSTDLTGLNEV
ncbi:hypothetical protein OHB56_02455 [Streptomyces sp. NBC_01635]|uniref:hypothetical protein n=1 Tax=Streptomyces sp. NBC_01635 TaxID=2975904 RepID=UPI0038680CAC|nr:hypothetical protein OHB56_02455 [Streptomyces sp. NBC_01635]